MLQEPRRLSLTTALLQLPAARRYRLPPGSLKVLDPLLPDGSFRLGPWRLQHVLQPKGTRGEVLVDGSPISVERSDGRWGPGRGGWVLRCQGCGAAVRTLHQAGQVAFDGPTDGPIHARPVRWRCASCFGLKRPPRLGQREAVVVAAPERRPGEPRWRWLRRAERAARLLVAIEHDLARRIARLG
jgi:hypothetical protein